MASLCPTGGCDPGNLNGRGIYTEKDSNYCVQDSRGGMWCPEAFVNRQAGVGAQQAGVAILYRRIDDRHIRETRLHAMLTHEDGSQENIRLVNIRASESRLSIEYTAADGSQLRTTGLEPPSSLWLGFYPDHDVDLRSRGDILAMRGPFGPFVLLMLKKDSPLTSGSGNSTIHRYHVDYISPLGVPISTCDSDGAPAPTSFVGAKRVDAVSAEVWDQPEVTTMGCETGAIVACLAWGYTPWNPKTGDPNKSDYLFRTCLQAKRAAYFVGHQEFTSYTVNGTRIVRRDPFGITRDTVVPRVEALWSPRGAECLNPDNRRVRGIELPAEILSKVPLCEPLKWGSTARIATGLPSGHWH